MTEAGKIYRAYSKHAKPAKDKILICISLVNGHFLYINTENYPKSDSITIPLKGHESCLLHDSFIGCKAVVPEASLEMISLVGQLTEETTSRLITQIEASKVLTPVRKSEYCQELRGYLSTLLDSSWG